MMKQKAIERIKHYINDTEVEIVLCSDMPEEPQEYIDELKRDVEAYKLAIKALEEMKDNAEN